MKGIEKAFVFLVTGKKDNEGIAFHYLEKEGYDGARVVFKLDYTAPYHNFTSIRDFQNVIKYRPFEGVNRKMAVAIIDLSDWLGHEQEDYLEIFFKYLHDFKNSFYSYEFIFTAGDADEKKMKDLYMLADEYLYEGETVFERTLVEEQALADYLMEAYPFDKKSAEKFAGVFVKNQVKGFVQLNRCMTELQQKIKPGRRGKITLKEICSDFAVIENSKFGRFYEEDVKQWKQEEILIFERGEVA
jgi:hypothetical protein